MQYNQSINEIVLAAHETAVEKGFYDDIDTLNNYLDGKGQHALQHIAKRDFVLAQLSLVGSEVSETVQEIRRNDVYGEHVAEELADILIRVCDLAGYLEINLGRAVHMKMTQNKLRPRKHGKIC